MMNCNPSIFVIFAEEWVSGSCRKMSWVAGGKVYHLIKKTLEDFLVVQVKVEHIFKEMIETP